MVRRVEVYSPGLEAHSVNPRAVKVMAEVGVRDEIRRRIEALVAELKDLPE